jgi:hypothetical protein
MLVSCCALAIPTLGSKRKTTVAIAVRTIIIIIISTVDESDSDRLIASRTLYTSQSEIRLWINNNYSLLVKTDPACLGISIYCHLTL